MSIVEKAVGRHESDGKRGAIKPAPAPRQTAPQSEQASPAANPPVIVHTGRAAESGLVSMEEHPALAQDFRFLKRPLLTRLFRPGDAAQSTGHIVLVTSDLPGAGKSFVSLNLAIAIAREQLIRVVLIDGDPLRRNLTTALGMEDQPGLMELLVDPDGNPDQFALATEFPSLQFIPAGQPREDSTELLAGRRLGAVLDSIDDPDTVILLDSPPLLLTAEARVLVERANHTLVVVEAGRTSVSDMASVFKLIGEATSNVSLVLNKAPHSKTSRDAGYYGYGYGSEYTS